MVFAERTSSNEVRFAAKDDYGHFCEYPHSSKAEAEQDERLLKSDVWEVFYVTEKTLVGAHDKCIEITFKDGRVSSFEIKQIMQLETFLYMSLAELVHTSLFGIYLGVELLNC